ncbi:hypothetical protein BGZ46_005444 [Entomortierella lignicola]|nr:hypothetical protein BGZ46_005444 [Entomortierella lignicola]
MPHLVTTRTSQVTHLPLQTLLGYFAFDDIITTGRLTGIVLILGGGALYTYAKDQEMRANTKPTYIPMTQQDVNNNDEEGHQKPGQA